MISEKRLKLRHGIVHVRFYSDLPTKAVEKELSDRMIRASFDGLANLEVVNAVVVRKREKK